jgi:hypothetical protein
VTGRPRVAAVRDPALARRELDEGLAALNRLNARLVGAPPTEAAVEERDRSPQDRTPKIRAPRGGETKREGRTERRPDGTAIDMASRASARSGAAQTSRQAGPAGSGRPGVARDRAKPRLRDRYAPVQLVLRAGLTALAAYCVVVGFVTSWTVALVCLLVTNFGVGIAGGGSSAA